VPFSFKAVYALFVNLYNCGIVKFYNFGIKIV
jgi:hypothetical protein